MMLGEDCFLPCTPHGMLELLERNNIETSGAECVVIGRSNIVGKPIANLMLQKRPAGNATVTLCHTRTKDMDFHTKRADILIVAVGIPNLIKADQIKEGVVILDVGVNRIGTTKEGKGILAGDVDFDSVKEKAGAITPVPGGVGPMTITMLMKNTVQAAKTAAGLL
jgi:methylenetetrahydrofolate dehydrogenase (NADP+)/methenyltetrahydrofolate cyclohydrolase